MSNRRGSLLSLSPRRISTESKPRRTRIEDESAIEKVYKLGETLGKGSFGVVKEVTHITSGQQYAMKMVNKDKPGSTSIQLLEREIEVLNRVNHPHLIQLIEVYETQKKVFLVLEMCRGGELSDLLKEKNRFKEDEVKELMKQLAEAVVYMHDKDMVHRDLKLENILLSTSESSEQFNIKVADFGLCHMKGLPGCDELMHSRCGTLYYMAPEVLKNKHEYSKLCDVWSMGVIMYALLCGRMPFNGDTASRLETEIMLGEIKFREPEWISIGEPAKELIRAMLNVDTVNRLTARQVLEDSWITGEQRKRFDPFLLMDDSPTPSPPQPQHESTITPPVRPFLKPTSKSKSTSILSLQTNKQSCSKGKMSSETEDIRKPTTQPGPRQAGCVTPRKLCSAKR